MNKKGFSTLATVLIVVAILAIAGIWYYEAHQVSLPTQGSLPVQNQSSTGQPGQPHAESKWNRADRPDGAAGTKSKRHGQYHNTYETNWLSGNSLQ